MEIKFTIIDPLGLHARPASLITAEASKFESEIKITKNNKSGNLKSIMGVMALGIKQGDEIVISAIGEDEEVATDSLKKLLKQNKII